MLTEQDIFSAALALPSPVRLTLIKSLTESLLHEQNQRARIMHNTQAGQPIPKKHGENPFLSSLLPEFLSYSSLAKTQVSPTLHDVVCTPSVLNLGMLMVRYDFCKPYRKWLPRRSQLLERRL